MDNQTIIAAGPVIIEDGKVLLVRHGADVFWKFPGGKWEEKDNDFEETARREAHEELGIHIMNLVPLKTVLVHLGKNSKAVLIHYLATRHGEIIPGSDIRMYEWIPITTLPEDIAPNVRIVIDDYLKRILTSR